MKKTETRTLAASAYSRRENKKAEKLRNLSDAELSVRERDANDQIFRLKFQLNMGQTDSLKKIRTMRRDLARVKTIAHARKLGVEPTAM